MVTNSTVAKNEEINIEEKIRVQPNVMTKRLSISNIVYKTIKRLIDICAGLIGTIILIPITIWVILLRKIYKEKGPIFYDQLRIGKNGEIFKIYKFRSMIIGADEALKNYLETHPEEAKEYQKFKKLKDDPRVTKTGKILRKTSLDEWPQFVSVLSGKMSLVGPRPYLLREKEEMSLYYANIIKVKPGLTGPWQIGGRSNVTFNDRLDIDEKYVMNLSIKNDLKIIIKTITKVFGKDGAC